MNIFYEESGRFKVAQIIERNAATYQVNTQHGKRSKVRVNHVFVEFSTDLDDFLTQAQILADDVDVDLLWSVCGEEEVSAESIAGEYFGHAPKPIELAAIFMALYAAPIYFHKKAKGIFKAAPEDILQQALEAVERKKTQDAQIDAWTAELHAFRLPEEVASDLTAILHQPNKQSLTYKAYIRAADEMKLSPLALAKACGAIKDMAQYLYDGFVLAHFPKGINAPANPVDRLPELPRADDAVRAFSIDDRATTEVDDALSVVDLGAGRKKVGVHIAAPSLAVAKDSAIEQHILTRHSTVYYPSGKITMLPENWIGAFSLDEGAYRPCVSIYFTVEADGSFGEAEHQIEQVWIENNLRIQDIEPYFNRENGTQSPDVHFAHHADLQYLYQWAITLQKKRNRYEENPPVRHDYHIEIEPNGHIVATERERGAPLDMVVSEMMILANSTWAQWLDQNGIGGIFRVQPPMGRVRMSTQSEAHNGMGVAHYAWFTSPLRRSADYINQRQLMSLIDAEQYPVRFNANDADLFAALRDFETTYTAYGDFQTQMEHYYSLCYIAQENLRTLNATLLKEDLVRIEGLPIVTRALGIPPDLPPKTRIELHIQAVDAEERHLSLKYEKAILS